MTFIINPHGRLQEWIAEEKGYFTKAGLTDYELRPHRLLTKEAAPAQIALLWGLRPYGREGWLVALFFLLCTSIRLARFNVITHPAVYSLHDIHATKDFVGLPVPAAAGMIASLVLLLTEQALQRWAVLLPLLMLLIAYLMVSTVRYPSFKEIDCDTKARFRTFIMVLVGVALVFLFRVYALVIIFLSYVFWGVARHILVLRRRSLRLRQLKSERNDPVKNPPEGSE